MDTSFRWYDKNLPTKNRAQVALSAVRFGCHASEGWHPVFTSRDALLDAKSRLA